jgi:hypothetical protein
MSALSSLSLVARLMPQHEPPEPVDEWSSPPPELLSKAQDLLTHAELLDIRPCAISASIEQAVAPGTHVGLVEMDLAMSFAADEGVYGNRFDYRFELKGDLGDTLGRIEFSLLLEYEVVDDFKPDLEAAEFVMGTTGYFAAYPYARELFQSVAGRLQFDPVVLGLIKRGSMRPGTISVVPHQLTEA